MSGLRLPVWIHVADYDQAGDIARTTDALVYGGGPIMDLPELMVRHLRTATTAVKHGRPFLIEGVGIGPFRSRIVKATARALLQSATLIWCRAHWAAQDRILRGMPVTVVADPAFDYLAFCNKRVRRRGRVARVAVDEATDSQPGALRVGINLRPLWSKYADRRVDLRDLETRTVKTIAQALCRARESIGIPLHVVFFPMNADTYGFSDLSVGHALARETGPEIPVQVCEHELLVDEVRLLLSRLDVVVAMRFHAAVFALAAGLPTIGIDYRVGRPGKVADLFRERGLPDRLGHIDTLHADRLADQLCRLAAIQATAHPHR